MRGLSADSSGTLFRSLDLLVLCHICRALIIICIILSFFKSILVLVGMKCTKIEGSELANARVTFAGGMNYLIGGMCSVIAFSYYGNKIRKYVAYIYI
uniref:Uncharacterized protein n=1 Tax=Oreochromis niloticus TaxID=8128 RepID=A0A669EHT5_ORENI